MRKGSRLGRRPTPQSFGLIPPNSSEPVTKDRNDITKIYDHKTYTPESWGSLTCKTTVCRHYVSTEPTSSHSGRRLTLLIMLIISHDAFCKFIAIPTKWNFQNSESQFPNAEWEIRKTPTRAGIDWQQYRSAPVYNFFFSVMAEKCINCVYC
jgi:hypothetical protein